MIKYLSIIKQIHVAELIQMFLKKLVLRFNKSNKIVSDRNFVFTNEF